MSQTKAQLISDLVQALNFTGTASAPANGAFLSAANTLALATNSTQRLMINASGEVGIGAITSPDGLLHVLSGSAGSVTAATDANTLVLEASTNVGISLLTANDSQARIKFGDPDANNAGSLIYNHQNDKISIVTATGNRMIIGSDMISARTSYGILRTTGGYTFRETNEGSERAGIHSDSSNNLIFKTASAAEKMRIQANGLIGIGTTSPSAALELVASTTGRSYSVSSATELVVERDGNSQISIIAANSSDSIIHFGDTDDENIGLIGYDHANNSMRFRTNDSVHMTLDSSGRLLMGTTSARSPQGINTSLQVEGTDAGTSSFSLIRNSANQHSPNLIFNKTRGTSVGSATVVQHNDALGMIAWVGGDGTDSVSTAARITGAVDGTPGSNDMPGRLEFLTTADGGATPTERMRITKFGEVLIGKTTTSLTDDGLRLQGEGAMNLSRTSTSTNLATASGASIALVNPSATDGNFSNIGGYNSNSLVTSQIDFIHESHSSRHGAIAFLVHNGSSMPEMMRITKDGRVGIGTTSPTSTLQVDGDVRTSNRLGVGTAANFANIVSKVSGTGSYPPSGGLVQADNADSTAMFWNASNSANYTGLSIECRTTGAAYWMLANVYNSNFNGDLAFRTRTGGSSNAERVRFLRAGGITFNGDTATANALDDYEEGVHQVTITCTTSGSITLNTSFDTVAYCKIGNWINVHGRVRVSSVSSPSGQQLRVSLPFQSASLSEDAGRVFGVAFIENADENMNHYGIQPTNGGNTFEIGRAHV